MAKTSSDRSTTKETETLQARVDELTAQIAEREAEHAAELQRRDPAAPTLKLLLERINRAVPDTRTLDERMVAVQGELEKVPRRGHAEVWAKNKQTNERYKAYDYDYITEADLMAGIRPLLAAHGIAIYYSDELLSYQAGAATVRVTMTLRANGEQLELRSDGYAADLGDKAANKAKTNAVRYLLWKTFLQPSDDDDPEQASTTLEDAAKADDARRRAADLRAGDQTRRTAGPSDTPGRLIERISTLSVELDDVQGRKAGETLGELRDAIQAEHGAPMAELEPADLVKIGTALAEHLDRERAASQQERLQYTPTTFTLPR